MRPEAVAEILLVRAVEEEHPEAIEPGLLIDALEAAGAPQEPRSWLARRAAWLCDHALARFHPLLAMPRVGLVAGPFLLIVAFVVGVLTNSFGPVERIHAIAHPIVALIVWNLLAYLLLVFGGVGRWLRLVPFDFGEKRRAERPPRQAHLPDRSSWRVRMVRRAVPALWLFLQRGRFEAQEQGRVLRDVARGFWRHWTERATAVFEWSTRRILHLIAIGVAAGAVAGTLVRGLFFDYHVVWRSTFLREPEGAARLLDLVLGPAARILGQPLPGEAGVRAMMGPEGVDAAPWILLFSVSALLWIGIPRLLLAMHATWRLGRLGAEIDLGLEDDYTKALLSSALSRQLDQVVDRIQHDVEQQSRRFADQVGRHVSETLYDERVVPRLQRFRQEGGRLADLETDVEELARSFQVEIEGFLEDARSQFETELARAVAERLNLDRPVAASPGALSGGEVAERSGTSARDVGNKVGRHLADVVASAVSAGVALGVGAVSGGFGKVLGTAVIVGLLHTTGPVGFLVGALAGLIGAGGIYWLGRDRAVSAVKRVSLPGIAVRGLLREARFGRIVEEGRETCRRSVRDLVQERLETLAPEIAERIWADVKPLVGERARPVSVRPK